MDKMLGPITVELSSKQRTSLQLQFDLLEIYSQLVDAVQFMHDKGVMHLDLKAANVVLTAKTRDKACPFYHPPKSLAQKDPLNRQVCPFKHAARDPLVDYYNKNPIFHFSPLLIDFGVSGIDMSIFASGQPRKVPAARPRGPPKGMFFRSVDKIGSPEFMAPEVIRR
jgi:serine/threonine protein kinase